MTYLQHTTTDTTHAETSKTVSRSSVKINSRVQRYSSKQSIKVSLSLLVGSLLISSEGSYLQKSMMTPSLQKVSAAEETILCSIDQDCKGLNDYFICKDILAEDLAKRVIPEGHEAKECVHKPLWPLEPKEWVGTFVFSLIMCLSNVAGIGGGGVAIPLAMYFFNLSTKPAIAISSFSIMLSTLTRFIYNFNERHPEKPNACCIDYNMTNVMMPLTMLGSLVGAFIYLLFPELLITIILTLLLVVLSWESGKKFIQIYNKEKKQEEEKAAKAQNSENQNNGSSNGDVESNNNQPTAVREIEGAQSQVRSEQPAAESQVPFENKAEAENNNTEAENKDVQNEGGANENDISMSPQPREVQQDIEEMEGRVAFSDVDPMSAPKAFEIDDKNEIELKKGPFKAKDDLPIKADSNLDQNGLPILPTGDEQKDKEILILQKIVKQEESHGQWKKQGLNFLCLACLLIQSLLRGGKGDFSIEKCSAGDWVFFGVFFVVMLCIVYVAVKMTSTEQQLKKKYNNVNLAESDLVFEGKILKNVLCLGFFGGWVAGALGLGGGVIFNPLLLAMGVPPKVSSATGMYIITFSKIATCVIYLLYGLLQMDYGLWIAFWSSVGAVCGLKGANYYMEKFGRQSIIVFCLTFIMIISTIGVPIFGFIDLKKKADNGENIKAFGSIC